MLMTIMANTVAASGVPNSAAKNAAHSRHGGRAQIPVIQMKQQPCVIPQSSAHLQRRAFPSGRTAAQMGEHRSQENRRQQQQGKSLAQMDLIDDIIVPWPSVPVSL